ncbi:hypothetical protein [Geothrix edaphica]|uniref:Uncharacterized protein n=1 Tax=Geothrix edaphica TaxID=2927976 RepID=A0ABQ5PVK9_9BACT|nr:hypothetical protein [Geothrix edaphica]GLH66165.1 hypothetical protein GETHED_05290 [Geothrix edaphica]
MRTILRAILAVALLLGGWGGDWVLAGSRAAQSHDCCCGTMPSGMEDPCPCPKPEGNRTPLRGACTERQAVAAQAVRRSEQGERRTEPRPEPSGWARSTSDVAENLPIPTQGGRDPDLGRHLARLNTLRI